MLALVPGGVSASMRDLAVSITGAPASSLSTVAVFTLVLLALMELVAFPQRFYQTFVLEHRYGLSAVPLRVWIGDHLKGLALSLALVLGAAFVGLAVRLNLRPRCLARWSSWCWPG